MLASFYMCPPQNGKHTNDRNSLQAKIIQIPFKSQTIQKVQVNTGPSELSDCILQLTFQHRAQHDTHDIRNTSWNSIILNSVILFWPNSQGFVTKLRYSRCTVKTLPRKSQHSSPGSTSQHETMTLSQPKLPK